MNGWRWLRRWLRPGAGGDDGEGSGLPGMPFEPVVIVLPARLESKDVEALERDLRGRLEDGQVQVLVDMGAVDHASSRLWGALVASLQQARNQGGDIRLTNLRPHVKKLFVMSGLSNIFTLHGESIEEFLDDE